MDQREPKQLPRRVAVGLLVKLPRQEGQVAVERQRVDGEGPRRDAQHGGSGRTERDASQGVAKCDAFAKIRTRYGHHSKNVK